jgi:hypothetical protein
MPIVAVQPSWQFGDAHRAFGSSNELRDPQRLLHQPEEQFDPPAALVEIGDLLRRRVEAIVNRRKVSPASVMTTISRYPRPGGQAENQSGR